MRIIIKIYDFNSPENMISGKIQYIVFTDRYSNFAGEFNRITVWQIEIFQKQRRQKVQNQLTKKWRKTLIHWDKFHLLKKHKSIPYGNFIRAKSDVRDLYLYLPKVAKGERRGVLGTEIFRRAHNIVAKSIKNDELS